MKVALSLEVTDDQRRALAGGKLATRDMVRAYVEGAVTALELINQPKAEAHHPPASSTTAPSTPALKVSAPEFEDWPEALKEKVMEKRAAGWREDEIAAYARGWFYRPRSI